MRIFGDDYPTPDGTCIRDYIHVDDLATAHLLALDATEAGRHEIYNLGNGISNSNKEILATVAEVTGRQLDIRITGRRHHTESETQRAEPVPSIPRSWAHILAIARPTGCPPGDDCASKAKHPEWFLI